MQDSKRTRTIEKHLEHVFDKLGVSSRGAAVACALDGLAGLAGTNRSERGRSR